MFSFYLNYLIYYLLGAAVLIVAIVTGYWQHAPSALLWCGWLGLFAWLLFYHIVVARLHYRSLRRTAGAAVVLYARWCAPYRRGGRIWPCAWGEIPSACRSFSHAT